MHDIASDYDSPEEKAASLLRRMTILYLKSMTKFYSYSCKSLDVINDETSETADFESRDKTDNEQSSVDSNGDANDASDSSAENNKKVDLETSDKERFEQVYNEVGVIYPLSLFESYLNGLSSLLFHAYPDRVLGKSTIEVRQLVGGSRSDIINLALKNKLKTFSRETILGRIGNLQNIFNLSFNISELHKARLSAIIISRNEMVHANYAQEIHLSDDLSVELQAEREQPELPDADVVDTCEKIVAAIYKSVSTTISGRELKGVEAEIYAALME